ncbi:hypothetical protein Tco_0368906 [Tanacetum coccineum]
MVKNLDNVGKFLMYPRFMQVFLDKQLEGIQSHKRIYDAPSHTKKIFRNMKRVGKGFSGRETPLFPTMVVQNQAKMGEGSVPQPSGPTTNVADEAVYEEMDDSLERAATTASGLDAEHDRGGGPRVLALKTTKTTQANEIDSLKRRVKRLEKKDRKRTHKLKRLYKVDLTARVESSEDEGLGEEDASKQGRIADIDANEDIYLVNVQNDEDMFGVNDLDGDEVLVELEVAVKDVNLSVDEVTLAQALAALKIVSTRPRAKGLVIHEQEQAPTPTVSSQQPSQVKEQDKGKGIMVEEPVSKIEADYQLAQRLQAQEQEELTDEEKARLFVQFLEQRRKHFTAKRAKEKRNRPPTRSQQRSIMCPYLKNMEGWKPKDLKNKTELVEESSKKAEVEIAQEKSLKKVDAEIVQESSSKRA